jgi:hypothetical protein
VPLSSSKISFVKQYVPSVSQNIKDKITKSRKKNKKEDFFGTNDKGHYQMAVSILKSIINDACR